MQLRRVGLHSCRREHTSCFLSVGLLLTGCSRVNAAEWWERARERADRNSPESKGFDIVFSLLRQRLTNWDFCSCPNNFSKQRRRASLFCLYGKLVLNKPLSWGVLMVKSHLHYMWKTNWFWINSDVTTTWSMCQQDMIAAPCGASYIMTSAFNRHKQHFRKKNCNNRNAKIKSI